MIQSKQLKRISKKLQRRPFHSKKYLEATVGNVVEAEKSEKEIALDELIDLVYQTPNLVEVVNQHKADPTILREIYHWLIITGGGQVIKRHFVPASSIMYRPTLDYLLSQYNQGAFNNSNNRMNVAIKMVNYFSAKETLD